jgi:hypothetical protein
MFAIDEWHIGTMWHEYNTDGIMCLHKPTLPSILTYLPACLRADRQAGGQTNRREDIETDTDACCRSWQVNHITHAALLQQRRAPRDFKPGRACYIIDDIHEYATSLQQQHSFTGSSSALLKHQWAVDDCQYHRSLKPVCEP